MNYKFIKQSKCKLEKQYDKSVVFYSWRFIARSYSQTLKSNFSKMMVQKIMIQKDNDTKDNDTKDNDTKDNDTKR